MKREDAKEENSEDNGRQSSNADEMPRSGLDTCFMNFLLFCTLLLFFAFQQNELKR